MKKSLTLTTALVAIAVFAAVATASITGHLYGHGLFIESVPGKTTASITSGGALTVTSITNTGAMASVGLSNTGTLANTGALNNIGAVSVATSATSGYALRPIGAVVTLATHTITEGQLVYQVSDHKLYVATKTVTSNDPSCIGTGCYSALN